MQPVVGPVVRGPVLRVDKGSAQDAIEWAKAKGRYDHGRRVERRNGIVLIPVTEAGGEPPFAGQWDEADLPGEETIRSYKDIVQLPEHLRRHLPSSYDVVGDVAIVKVPEALAAHAEAIGHAMRAAQPGLRAVFHDQGVRGEFRLRSLRRLAGAGGARTQHTEFGRRFQVDLEVAYFSPRLASEHERVARLVGTDERVLDATAGVGPYALAIADHQPTANVHAVDINPDAVHLAQSNMELNHVDDRVQVVEADGFAYAEEHRGWDRIVANLPHGETEDLERLASALRPGGTLHLTRVLSDDTHSRALNRLARRCGCSVAYKSRVHTYSPREALYACDLSRQDA